MAAFCSIACIAISVLLGGKIHAAFAHLSLLLKLTLSSKLSKRDGDRLGFPVSLEWRP